MATNREQPYDEDDAEVASLLESRAPQPRDEFVRALSGRLDAQFAARAAAGGQRATLIEKLQSPSGNGVTNGKGGAMRMAETNGHVEKRSVPAAVTATAAAGTCPWRRWMVAAAMAASLFVALVVWGPAFGWTAAIRAWVVSMVVQNGNGGESSGAAAPVVVNDQVADNTPSVDAGVAAVVRVETPPMAARSLPLPPAESPTASGVAAEEVITVQVASKAEATGNKAQEPAADVAPAETKADAPQWAPFDEPLPIEELSQRVDDQLSALWMKQGIRPAGLASDAEFMRRVYLDLTGRIPSVNEVHEFFDDPAADKRERLVDRLLAHHDHSTHLAAVWRSILLPETMDLTRLGGTTKFEEWLAAQFAVNKPYDEIVRSLLLVEGRVAESGPLLYYAAARLLPEELAGKTSRAFLGVRMECAQCHDHPFDDVSQKDFWRFAAFFARISRPKGKMDVASPVLQVRDSTQGDVMIPNSDEVVPARLPLVDSDIAESPDGPPLRQHLADWLTSTKNGQFSRATVNRVWAHLFGRGLVDPVDDMRPANPPLAPEVLDTLSRDFAASKFDLRRLFRALVLTKAYQLSSRSDESDPARAIHFAQMNVKSFTAEQLYDCITIATRRGASPALTAPPNAVGVERFQDASRQAFIQQFQAPAGKMTDYHAGIPQALTLMHGGLIHTSTDLATSGLLKSLGAPFLSDERRVDTLFLSTLSRYPEPAEREVINAQMAAAETREQKQQVLGDVLWALLNSGEFTFNH